MAGLVEPGYGKEDVKKILGGHLFKGLQGGGGLRRMT
jgi:hypothetical protein